MLEGVKVVELATMVAAPTATGMLADWGAQVIKIEPHRGDPMRGGPGGGALGTINFDLHNRGKRSIALDTNAPDTRAIVLKLIADADLFVTNMLPEQLVKLKFDWQTLHALNPRMVYGAVSSFGRAGPDRDRGATDNLGFWSRGAGTALLTVEGTDPVPFRQSVGDRITGITALAGMMAALVEAQRTGAGVYIDTSLMSAGMWAFSTDISNQMNKGRTAWSKPRQAAAMPLNNYFKTKDGRWVTIMASVDAIASAIERPDLAADPRFQGARVPREHQGALIDAVDEAFARFTLAELMPRLEGADVRAEPIQRPEDLPLDPQVQATGRLVQVEGPEGPQWHVANPWTLFDEAGEALTPALGRPPAIGEHTIEVLRELGYGDDDIVRMKQNNTIMA